MVKKHIVIIGGGPSGIMAAIKAAQLKQNVTLLEKNSKLGRKLLLSGNNRCNLSNSGDLNSFLGKFSKDGEFLRDAFKTFFNNDLISFFQRRGLKFKIENNGRIFPATDKANSVLEILNKELIRNSVKIISGIKAKNILTDNFKVKAVELEDLKALNADRVILATGGLSYSFTGSTGEGLGIAKQLGHKIVSLRPGLIPLEIKQRYPKILEGLALKGARLKFSDGKNVLFSEIGDLLFTSFGISGPLVLSLSGKVVDWLLEGKSVFVEIDLKPDLPIKLLDKQLLTKFKENPRKNLRNLLADLIPCSLADLFLDLSDISKDKKVSQIAQPERQKIISLLKCWRLDILKARPIEEAMITRGGVSLKDINPRTMESRIIGGLYFAGEVIDIDADTGGFNLQAAFSTGYLAGQSAALS